MLGEAVVSEKEAEEYVNRYTDLLEVLRDAQKSWETLGDAHGELDWDCTPKVSVSVKPSAMYSQMNARAFEYSVAQATENIKPVFRKAIEVGAHICLDMEHYDLKNLTLSIYKSLLEDPEFRDYPHTGL